MASAMKQLNSLNRNNLHELTVDVIRPARDARPELRLVQVDGVMVVVKDFAAGSNSFKRMLGSYLISREYAAYRRLGGVAGIPCCYGRLDRYALVLEHVPAEAAWKTLDRSQVPAFIERLRSLLDEIHARGVVHGDTHKLDNILVDQAGNPVLVDFAASLVTGSNPAASLLFPLLVDDDLRGMLKLKQHVAPELMTPQELEFFNSRPPVEKFFRSWREYGRKAIKRWSGGTGTRYADRQCEESANIP